MYSLVKAKAINDTLVSLWGRIDLRVEIDKAIHPVTLTVTRGLKNMILISHYKGDISHSYYMLESYSWTRRAQEVALQWEAKLRASDDDCSKANNGSTYAIVELEALAAVCENEVVTEDPAIENCVLCLYGVYTEGDVRLTESGP
ncbi:hypothetical protein Pelo_19197 [Pelomyxa schiedti]|nr:hypothetical protein Pelo_19197 [Pelomyxa schiedti]